MGAGPTVRFGSVRSVVTQRMVLRSWTIHDRDPWHELATNPSVIAHVCAGTPPSSDVVEQRFRHAVEESDGCGIFACEELDQPGAVIGLVGFSPTNLLPDIPRVQEIEWRFLPEFWGRGLATEAVTTALSWVFGADIVDRVVACIQAADHRSSAVADRVGMRPSFRTVIPGCGRWVDVYELSAKRWDQR